MDQTGKVLLVIVFEVGVVILDQQVLVHLVIQTCIVEFIALLSAARRRQAAAVTGATAGGVLQLAADQGQVVDVFAGDLSAFEGLRQQAAIVAHQDRQIRAQVTVAQLGLGKTRLGRRTTARPAVGGLAVIVGDHRAAHMAAGAAVEGHAEQADGIQTKADGAIGETRLVIKDKRLAPLFGLRRCGSAVAVVVIEIEVAHVQVGCAVAQKISRGQGAQGNAQAAGQYA